MGMVIISASYHDLFFSFPALTPVSEMVLKLMGSYLVIAFTGFMLILLFLEKIGAKSDPEKPCLQVRFKNCSKKIIGIKL